MKLNVDIWILMMLNNLRFSFPIKIPFSRERDELAIYEEAIQELKGIGKIPSLDPGFGGAPITIRVLSSPKRDKLVKDLWTSKTLRSYSLVNFSIDATYALESIGCSTVWSDMNTSELEKRRICLDYLRRSFELEANLFLLSANIARPGVLSADKGFAFFNGHFLAVINPFISDKLYHGFIVSTQVGWPHFSWPTIAQTWRWLIRSGAINLGVGVGRLGIALAALSYLTNTDILEENSLSLVWVLLGLEALYLRNHVGLKEQLLEKSDVVVGPRVENKKEFGRMYEFRSRLIHGNVDIPFRFSEFDGQKEFEDFHLNRYYNEDIALSTLLATLQWMVVNDRYEFDFEYALR